MITIKLGSNTYKCPQSWEECKPAQIKLMLALSRIEPQHRTREFHETLVKTALNISKWAWSNLVLSFEQWELLKSKFDWIYEQKVTSKPFDFFKHNGTFYILPQPNHADTTAIEIAVCNVFYLNFANPTTPNIAALDNLIAAICRPERNDLDEFKTSENWNGDSRIPFNDARTMEVGTAFATLDFQTKLAVFLFWEYQNHEFLQRYGQIFGKGKGNPRYKDGLGWLVLLKSTAQSGYLGNFDEVSRTPAHFLFTMILDDVLTAAEQEAELDKQYPNRHDS